jgi:hypothetical protein
VSLLAGARPSERYVFNPLIAKRILLTPKKQNSALVAVAAGNTCVLQSVLIYPMPPLIIARLT